MSEIVGQLARVRGAFEQPTLTLLHQKSASVIIAVFRTSFGRDVRTIPTARLHDQVDAYIGELKHSSPVSDFPHGNGRELCLRWMRGRWLVRDLEEDGTEVYSLTSHAQDALNLVRSLTHERANLSEHRIATILGAVRRFNSEVNPDRAARVAILNAEIAKLTDERNRLVDGGEIPQVTPEYMLEGYSELLQLVAALPSDFARVEEAFASLRTQILAEFLAEFRPAGEVIDDYLQRTDNLTTATPEGQAFEGAFTLLRDEELLLQLREDLSALLDHPLANEILIDSDRHDLRGTVALIRSGIEDVLSMRTRVTATLREYIVTHDMTRDRELDNTLRRVDSELTIWMERAGARATVPLPLLPARVDVSYVRERFYDPRQEEPPPPLSDMSEGRPAALSLAELLLQGGPSLESLRRALRVALNGPDPLGSLGRVFEGLDPQLRRPVEIFGLLHLAANQDNLRRTEDTEVYDTVRPDGSSRPLAVPRLATDTQALTKKPTATLEKP